MKVLLGIVAQVAAMLFPLWPALLAGALWRERRRWQRGRPPRRALLLWTLLAGLRILVALYPDATGTLRGVARLVPPGEPWSTALFLLLGAGGLGYYGLRPLWRSAYWQRRIYGMAEEDLFRVSPKAFEEMVAALFRAFGYQVELRGGQGDHGVDLLVFAPDGDKAVVQCKRWRRPVGEPVVRDLYGVMHHEKAQRAYLFATGGFTPRARSWARGKPILLYDARGFLRLWRRARRRRTS